MDLSLKFDTQAFVATLGPVEDREPVVVQLKGNLKNGTPIQGEDVIIILDKGQTHHGMGALVGNIMDFIASKGAKK
jgi:hypothetical protein